MLPFQYLLLYVIIITCSVTSQERLKVKYKGCKYIIKVSGET